MYKFNSIKQNFPYSTMLVKETRFQFENIHYTRDEEDEDETLSLCDLPLYSNNDQGDESWEQQDLTSSSNSSSPNDYFEFITQEYFNPSTTVAAAFPQENIIFCGKLIPYRNPSEKGSCQSKNQTCMKKKSGWGLFKWKRCILSRKGEQGTTLLHKKGHQSSTRYKSPTKKHNKINCGKGYDFPVHKMSILTPSSSGKAKWYLFLFGVSRLSNEMELRDLKSRQSRRQCPPPPQPPFSFRSVDENGSRGRNRGWGLWGLISALSCSGHHLQANAMVAASFGGAPPPK